MINKVGNNIWYARQKISFMGIKMFTQMTVIKLKDNSLWLHSPIELTPELKMELDTLGTVSYLIAPNSMHHIFIESYLREYPNAKVFAPKLIQRKNKNLKIEKIFSNDNELNFPWLNGGEIEQLFVEGLPLLSETVFFHKESKTLILTDLLQNIHYVENFWNKAYFIFTGIYKKIQVSKVISRLIKDKQQIKASFEKILAWDFQRIHVCHDTNIETQSSDSAKKILKEAYNWL